VEFWRSPLVELINFSQILDKVKTKAGKMPTPQESCNSCGLAILPASFINDYFHFIYKVSQYFQRFLAFELDAVVAKQITLLYPKG
jgi:hypothetical protein